MKFKRAVIDRIESGIAVLEINGTEMADVPVNELPEGAKPGDWLKYKSGKYIIDENGTAEAQKRIKKLMDEVWKN